MKKLILLKRIRPEEYEVHKDEISQAHNLLITTKDKEFAERMVDGFNKYDKRTPKEVLIDFKNYWKKSSHNNVDDAIKGFLKTKKGKSI